MTRQLELLRKKIIESDLDTLLVSKGANTRYLTGFDGEGGFVTVNRLGCTLFVNSLFIEHARAIVASPVDVREIRDGLSETFSALGESFWGKRVGVEGDEVTCSTMERLRKALEPADVVPVEGIVEVFRERKETREIEAMTRAQRISERVLQDVLGMVREGVEERDLALEIDYRLRKAGGERSAFDTIVASGPNTSKPHAVPTARKLRRGDFVLFDMGTVVDGYSSDMTRTVVLGTADRKQRDVYAAVLDAQEAAIRDIHAGMRCDEADRLARSVIEAAGYGKEFVHSLGHGVGLEVHEAPRMSVRSETVLKPDMVVTVEPGIYIPEWGGVRIEDMVVVTEADPVNLTLMPKGLLEL